MNIDWTSLHGDAFRNARVLITGGAGFIGSNLADALVRLGASVLVLDDLTGTGGTRDNLGDLPSVEFAKGSILDASLLRQCMRERSLVFHQAALGSVPA